MNKGQMGVSKVYKKLPALLFATYHESVPLGPDRMKLMFFIRCAKRSDSETMKMLAFIIGLW
jgi:hypothetical protein